MIEALLILILLALLILLAVLFPAAIGSLVGFVGALLLGVVAWSLGGAVGLALLAIVVLWVAGRRSRPRPITRRPRPIPGRRSGNTVRIVVEHRYVRTEAPPARPEVAMVWDAGRKCWRDDNRGVRQRLPSGWRRDEDDRSARQGRTSSHHDAW
jgi:hypothetical protein